MILLGLQSNNSVVLGQEGLVHIVGQNNTQSEERLGIWWIVRDPDGLLCEQYSDWSFDNKPGDSHEFIGGRFEFFKEGPYTIDAELLMNKDNPVVVDSYSGNLCTVVTEVPPIPPTCVIDADCPEGYVCKDGICVPEEVVFPWLPVVLIGSGVVVASYLLLRKRKK